MEALCAGAIVELDPYISALSGLTAHLGAGSPLAAKLGATGAIVVGSLGTVCSLPVLSSGPYWSQRNYPDATERPATGVPGTNT